MRRFNTVIRDHSSVWEKGNWRVNSRFFKLEIAYHLEDVISVL
jgi:hypothetical protein